MGLAKILRKPVPRLLPPRAVFDIASSTSRFGFSSTFKPSSSEPSDTISTILSKHFPNYQMEEVRNTDLSENRDKTIGKLVSNLEEVLRAADPLLVSRVVTDLCMFGNIQAHEREFQTVFARVIERIDDMNLSCLARVVFALTTKAGDSVLSADTLRGDIYSRSSLRVYELISGHEQIAGQVLSKLCVSLSLLSGVSREEKIWNELERLTVNGAEYLEASQVQQVAFGFSRKEKVQEDVVIALTNRALAVSPVSNQCTYMNLLIALSRIQKGVKAEEWEIFKRVLRDHLGGLREGFIPLPELRRRMDLPDATLRRVRNSLLI